MSREDLIRRLSEETIHAGYKMISLDVKSLFTNVPVDKIRDFFLKKVYNEKKIHTNILKAILKVLHIFVSNSCISSLITISDVVWWSCNGIPVRTFSNYNLKITSLKLEALRRWHLLMIPFDDTCWANKSSVCFKQIK